MGDMADQALDHMMDMDELDQRYQTFEEATAFGVEDVLYNYDGSRIPGVFVGRRWLRRKACGPGLCPKCKSSTVVRKGPYGEFYGCVRFPECTGNRDW